MLGALNVVELHRRFFETTSHFTTSNNLLHDSDRITLNASDDHLSSSMISKSGIGSYHTLELNDSQNHWETEFLTNQVLIRFFKLLYQISFVQMIHICLLIFLTNLRNVC